jgi:hypothetical protein
MKTSSSVSRLESTRYIDAPNLSISIEGTIFAYRDLGPRSTVPLILLNHWGAVLDNFIRGLSTASPASIA